MCHLYDTVRCRSCGVSTRPSCMVMSLAADVPVFGYRLGNVQDAAKIWQQQLRQSFQASCPWCSLTQCRVVMVAKELCFGFFGQLHVTTRCMFTSRGPLQIFAVSLQYGINRCTVDTPILSRTIRQKRRGATGPGDGNRGTDHRSGEESNFGI